MSQANIENKKRKVGELAEEVSCPYLDTIQRSFLDFDHEHSCSVSLQGGMHIYGCLVCGKFFRGRGKATPAYTHSVEESHFVFVHLTKGTFHCLPDDYEIKDPSVSDIRAALHPTFNISDIHQVDSNTNLSRDLFGRKYLPGFVGLNNHNKTDCINAVVQALTHVAPIRDYFLSIKHDASQTEEWTASQKAGKKKNHTTNRSAIQVTEAFGELVRKMWSKERFKSTVDPHILVQSIIVASKKRFRVGVQAEAGELIAWLLHQLHVGTKRFGSSIVHKTFQGSVRVTVKEARKIDAQPNVEEDDDRVGSGDEEDVHAGAKDSKDAHKKVVIEETTKDTNFLQLTLDIPEKPLFRDDAGGLVIPQEPMVNVLKKFDGKTLTDSVSRSGSTQRKRYSLLKLSDYLILHLDRFKSNNYSREKNPTIVAFPVKNLDLHEYVFGGERPVLPTEEQIRSMSVKEIKDALRSFGKEDIYKGAMEKDELVEATINFLCRELPDLLADKYDLVANITHQSPADVGREEKVDPLQEGSYKCHVQHSATRQWYEIQDLHVQEIM
eukprot:CAMPEP_0198147704 /NCGR_PEP_ID=MMETSP1443-20131203/37352_1 /TAXON_ID=186043 /ORGANISM="Entomoneis sp., Strain CCMP2396" /LENGTH=551 /DNA_ID=CAMNT_0043812143 /DNA_START=39 /DNA_END=1691 /DNA_ORIENTATION=+